MNSKNVGIKDVAAAAGVSVTTVSHVLNDVASARVSPETRHKVRSTAEQLGYGPNSVARALRTSRTALLGLVIEDIGTSPHAGRTILGADEAARSRGYNLIIINTSGSAGPESRDAGVESLLARRVDGILYAAASHRASDAPAKLPANLGNVPAVLVGAAAGQVAAGSHSRVAAVVPDEEGGARAAVGCLLAAGHTRLGFINESGGLTSVDRLSGFRGALTQAGLDGGAAPVEAAQSAEPGGYEAALRMLGRADRPSALVCYDDRMAMGAYRAAAGLGLAIPGDLSVVAFADHELIAANLHPALTTVTLPRYEMAARATEILIDAIEGAAETALPVGPAEVLACTLAARGSVAPPRDPATPRGNF